MMFRKNLPPISALIVAATLIAGCSSYDEVANQEVTVRSTPDDAAITLNGRTLDRRTDTSLILSRNADHTIVVSKAGYKPASIRVTRRETGEDAPGAPKYELDRSAVAVTLEETDATRIAREGREAAERGEAAQLVGGSDFTAAVTAVDAAEKASENAIEQKTPEAFAAAEEAAKAADGPLKAAADNVNTSAKTVGAASREAAKTGDGTDPLAQARANVAETGEKITGLAERLAAARAHTADAASLAKKAAVENAARDKAARDVAAEEAAKKAAADKAQADADAKTAAEEAAGKALAEKMQAEADAKAEALIIENKAKADAAKKAQADADAAAEAQILANKQAAEKRAAEAAAKAKADYASKHILDRYVELRRQLKSGEISPDEYDAAVKALTAGK